MRVSVAALGLTISLLGGIASAEPWGKDVVERMRADIETLCTEPRPAGTARSAEVADWIDRQLKQGGLRPRRHAVEEAEVPAIEVGSKVLVPSRFVRRRDDRRPGIIDDNLVVRISGEEDNLEAALVMAHYDSVDGAPGAGDNAAAVAVLLEIARRLRATPPPRPVYIVLTAGEEAGLVGAYDLVQDIGDDVAFAVSLDLLGFAGTLTLNGLSSAFDHEWLSWLAGVAAQADVIVEAPVAQRVTSRKYPALERSDHGPFTRAGVPAFHLYTRGPDGIYLAYHTPHDVPGTIDDGQLVAVGRYVESLLRNSAVLPTSSGDLGMWLSVGHHVVVLPAAVVIGVEAGFAALALVGLWVAARRRGDRGRRRLAWTVGISIGSAALVYAMMMVYTRLSAHAHPWGHSPPRIAVLIVLIELALPVLVAALLGWRRVGGARRGPAVMATVLMLMLGAGASLWGAFELALVPALCAALAMGSALVRPRVGWLLALATGLPLVWFALAARESLFHGIYPGAVPFDAVVSFLAVAPILCLWTVADRVESLPGLSLGRRVVLASMAASVAAFAAISVLLYQPRCTGENYAIHGLSCEIVAPTGVVE